MAQAGNVRLFAE